MVNFDWYRSFAAVYRVGTVTGAAEERGLTQPAVTQHLAGLEAVVGTPLFTRTARRMLPTERGKQLYSQLADALETLDQVSQGLRRPPLDVLPLVRIGTPREYFAEVALAQLRDAPLRLTVQFGSARGLLEALHQGDLDLVIATERLNLRDLEYRKLTEEVFVLVGGVLLVPPVIQPSSDAERRQLEQWALAQPWVSYGSDLPIIRRFWRQCFGSRPTITPNLIMPDLTVMAEAVAAGSGVSVLPMYLCRTLVAADRLRILWEPEPTVTNDLWLAYRARDRQRPEVATARDALLAV